MPTVRQRPPSESRKATVRMAALRPTSRQMRRWRRDGRVRRIILYSFGGLVALLAIILAFGYWRENIARASEPAAVVLDDTIEMSELLARVRPRAAALDAQAQFYESQGIAQAATQLRVQRSGLPDQVLDGMIEEDLVNAELGRRGLAVADDEVQARIRKEIAEQEARSQPQPTPTPSPAPVADASPTPSSSAPTATATVVPTLTEDTFQTAYQSLLGRANLTDQSYRELIWAEVARDKLRDNLKGQVPATEEQVRARHILVDNQESLQKVQDALAQGVPFDQVAAENSTDPGSRDKGGDLGWFGRGVMNAPFESAAFNQAISEIGPPVESPNGTHVIQVLERDPNRALAPEQIDRQASQAYQAWYAGVKEGADVSKQMTPEKRDWILRQLGPRR